MRKRKLGRSGIEIAPLVLGGNVFGWTASEATSFSILDAFVDAGFNAIDTADVYSVFIPGNKGGESETVIGNWLKHSGKRSQVVIATKVGMQMAPDKTGLSRKHIMQSVEDSLRRLQTDYIDMYFAHQDDPQTELAETLATFGELVSQGKVRTIGASNYTGIRLKEALTVSAQLGLPRYEYLQPHYNLYERAAYEQDLEPVCMREQLGVVPYFALASGFLTGKYRSEADFTKSPRGRRMGTYMNPHGLSILKGLDEVAARYGATPAQVALAWLMSRPSVTAPISSATSVEQLRDIAAAARLDLDREAIQTLDTASKAAA
jgi:aryl-alcohol dehydrogenase-like predicted oxidoreductase